MSEAKVESSANLSPSQQELLELGSDLSALDYNLWGHGTPVSDPDSFFEEGVRTDSSPDLLRYAVPLSAANVTMVDNWPHKRSEGLPNVVLLAVPNADPESQVTISHVAEHVFDVDRKILPAKFILGFYDSTTRAITRNPGFKLDKGSHRATLEEIKAKMRKEQVTALAHIAVNNSTGPLEITNALDSDNKDVPEVW